MHRQYLLKLILAWMIAWLPVAGVLASTMPIASFAESKDTAIAPDQSKMIDVTADADRMTMPCHDPDVSNNNADGNSCSHCVLCHLAGAIVPPTMPALQQNSLHDTQQTIDSVSFTSFIAELPQRPPSRSRA